VEWLGCCVRMDVERRAVKKIKVGKSRGRRKEKR
jgi:hypothetical protein